MRTSDAFAKLGLPQTATAAEVKSAYRQKAASPLGHPDKGGSAEAFNDLNEAYEVALRETVRPVHCPACEGSGKVAFAKAGFAAVERRCNTCRGTGCVERGAQAPVHHVYTPAEIAQKIRQYGGDTVVGFNPRQVQAALASFQVWHDKHLDIEDARDATVKHLLKEIDEWLASLKA